MTDIVEAAQRSTYQLTRAGSAKLRRMTRASGLSSENVVSRIAIMRSLAEPLPDPLPEDTTSADGKEIRGATLIGRSRPAALLLAMMARQTDASLELEQVRRLIRFHWERGLALLVQECPDGNVTDWFARNSLVDESSIEKPITASEAPTRDEIAAAIGRRYGRWPLEVRRLAALAGRLDLAASNEAADRLAARAEELGVTSRVSEALALRIMKEWGLNRLGLNSSDRDLLKRIAQSAGLRSSDVPPRSRASLEFLVKLRLVRRSNDALVPSSLAVRLGEELWTA